MRTIRSYGNKKTNVGIGYMIGGKHLRAGLGLAQLVINFFDRVSGAAVGKPSPRHAVLGLQTVGGQTEITNLP